VQRLLEKRISNPKDADDETALMDKGAENDEHPDVLHIASGRGYGRGRPRTEKKTDDEKMTTNTKEKKSTGKGKDRRKRHDDDGMVTDENNSIRKRKQRKNINKMWNMVDTANVLSDKRRPRGGRATNKKR
jgi:hypothetical protein